MPLHGPQPERLQDVALPGSLGGYRLLLEWVFLRLALNQESPIFIFFLHSQRGEVHSKWNAIF